MFLKTKDLELITPLGLSKQSGPPHFTSIDFCDSFLKRAFELDKELGHMIS
jgi:hypothetical protein